MILCHERKRKDWAAFDDAKQNLGIVTSPAEQETALSWAAGDLMENMAEGMRLVIVCDDLLNLLSNADLSAQLAEIASMGAGLGIHLLAGTQEAGSKRGTGGAGVENNATARVLYRNSSAAGAARATGQGAEGLQQLSGAKGDALLLLDGEPSRVATGLSDDRAIMQLGQGEKFDRPWVRVGQGEPAEPAADVYPNAGERERSAGGMGSGGSASGSQSNGAVPAVVPADAGPVLDGEPRTAENRATVREVFALLGSKNKAVKALWGYKSGKTMSWLNDCIAEPESVPAQRPAPSLRPATDAIRLQ